MSTIILLEVDWDDLLEDKKWVDLGKCLRAMIKIHKTSGQLREVTDDIERRIEILEDNLDKLDARARFRVIGDIDYARRAIDSSSTVDYGSAFSAKRKG